MKVRAKIVKSDSWDQAYPSKGEYVVFSMEIYNGPNSGLIDRGNVIYIIDTDTGLRWFNLKYFDIIDSRISRFWEFYIGDWFCELWSNIWIWNIAFQSKVMYDFDEDSINKLRSYKNNIELEFNDINNKNAIIIDKNWIQCLNCSNIWENYSTLWQVLCPNCESKMNNPTYIS